MTDVLRIAAIGDLHCKRTAEPELTALVAQASAAADVLLLCGDLTDYGLPEEARVLAHELRHAVHVPMIAVLGNHDYESGAWTEVRDILCDAGVEMLDGGACEVRGVGFAGVKGFGGGFGERMLGAWGEPIIKQFVHEAIDEALKLEGALAKLHTPQRIALLHYSPTASTVVGEAMDLFPFLGSSRLEEPLDRHPVAAVVHGHAHHGQPEGATRTGTPVYNVALPVLRRVRPERPFHLIELPVEA